MGEDFEADVRTLLFRLLASAPLILAVWILLRQGGLWSALAALACLIVTAVLVARPLVAVIVYPVGNLFWPDERGVPPPLHKLAEWHLRHGRVDDAVREYEKMIKYHPGETAAHGALYWIHTHLRPDEEQAASVRKRALKKLKSEEDRQAFVMWWPIPDLERQARDRLGHPEPLTDGDEPV